MKGIQYLIKRVWEFILKALNFIFIRPFQWFSSLPLKRKIIVSLAGFVLFCLLVVSGPIILYYSVVSGVFGKMPANDELQEIKKYQASEVYSPIAFY